MRTVILAAGIVLASGGSSAAQSLFERPPAPQPLPGERPPDLAAPLYGFSLTAVKAPEPKEYKVHDQVTIIINENSKQKSDQSLDTSKESDVKGEVNATLDPLKLITDAQLSQGDNNGTVLLDADADRGFKGDGKSSRDDQYTDRITATVLDVKPNGVLVLEARRVLQYDKDIKTVVVSGSCRTEDITLQDTIQSNQLADLTVLVTHAGPVVDAASKGWLTRFFEVIFPF
jgi:flagellar L-ring protein precursor FlgH